MCKLALAVLLALPPALAGAQGAPRPAADEDLTAAEYHAGLKTLRGYLEKRGLKPDAAERFVSYMGSALPPSAEGRRVAVTREVFASFLRYQAAWARKTRDGKHAAVTPEKLRDEVDRAFRLKEEFRLKAGASSPEFYRVFQAAVREVRGTRRRHDGTFAGTSAVFFSDDADLSYTHVDAGDVALENGDAAGAIAEAGKALAINPGNADAFVLRAGAQYDLGNRAAAVEDALSALVLDPRNPQAKAILSLSGAEAGRAALAKATAGGAALSAEGGREGLPVLEGTTGEPASATPAVGAMLSADLTVRAVDSSKADARSSIDELDRAITLNPRNASARSWRTALLNSVGDYASALASAELALKTSPDDAPSYFHKAYARAGAGDRAGALEALRQAARIDPAYRPALERALELPRPEDLELYFGEWSEAHPQARPAARRSRYPFVMVAFGVFGGMLLLAGVVQLFRKGR